LIGVGISAERRVAQKFKTTKLSFRYGNREETFYAIFTIFLALARDYLPNSAFTASPILSDVYGFFIYCPAPSCWTSLFFFHDYALYSAAP